MFKTEPPALRAVWRCSNEETSETMCSHICGPSQNCHSLLFRWWSFYVITVECIDLMVPSGFGRDMLTYKTGSSQNWHLVFVFSSGWLILLSWFWYFQGLVTLFSRITKLGWFDSEKEEFVFRAVITDVTKFLQVKMLNALIWSWEIYFYTFCYFREALHIVW